MATIPSVPWAARAGTAVHLKTVAARLRLHQPNVQLQPALEERLRKMVTVQMETARQTIAVSIQSVRVTV